MSRIYHRRIICKPQPEFQRSNKPIHAATEAGANAVKIQTYTPDTLTIKCNNEYFRICKGTQWEGKNLYELYSEAYTPWEWQPELQKIANDLGLDFFSTPFDPTSVEFLQQMDVPAFKIASFEIVDIPLIQQIARPGNRSSCRPAWHPWRKLKKQLTPSDMRATIRLPS